jgi:hypothetical protein
MDGASSSVTTSRIGQNARMTFSGAAGQNIGLGVTNVSFGSSTCCGVLISIRKPDGSTLHSEYFGTRGGEADPAVLPATGTYSIFFDPDALTTGSATLTLSQDVAATAPTVNSTTPMATADLTMSRVGQNGRITFSGTIGQTLAIGFDGMTVGTSTCCGVLVSIRKPDNSTLLSEYFGTDGGEDDLPTLPTSGTYTVFLDPDGLSTGTVQFALWDKGECSVSTAEDGVFWRLNNADGGVTAYGVMGDMSTRNHTILPPACLGSGTGSAAGSGKTVRLQLGGESFTYDEVGWKLRWCQNAQGTPYKCWTVFTEAALNGNPTASYQQNYPTTAYPCIDQSGSNIFRSWKEVLGLSPNWEAQYGVTVAYNYVRCGTSGDFQQIDYIDAYGFTWGAAEGEAFHRGGSGLLGEVHRNLKYLDASSQAQTPTDLFCRKDDSNRWDGKRISATEFRVVAQGNGEECPP